MFIKWDKMGWGAVTHSWQAHLSDFNVTFNVLVPAKSTCCRVPFWNRLGYIWDCGCSCFCWYYIVIVSLLCFYSVSISIFTIFVFTIFISNCFSLFILFLYCCALTSPHYYLTCVFPFQLASIFIFNAILFLDSNYSHNFYLSHLVLCLCTHNATYL